MKGEEPYTHRTLVGVKESTLTGEGWCGKRPGAFGKLELMKINSILLKFLAKVRLLRQFLKNKRSSEFVQIFGEKIKRNQKIDKN